MTYLDVGLVHFLEKVLDALLVLDVVEHQEPYSSGSDEGGDEPLVELVDNLEVHVLRGPLVLVNQVQRGVGNELVQVPVVVLLNGRFRTF